MNLVPVEAVEVRCDGCGGRMEYGDEYCFWLREQVSEWTEECGWREQDGKHYCCDGIGQPDLGVCWPPSIRDEHEKPDV